MPGAQPVVCRLKATAETMQKRLDACEPGMFHAEAIARAAELDGILDRARAEDFAVDNSDGRGFAPKVAVEPKVAGTRGEASRVVWWGLTFVRKTIRIEKASSAPWGRASLKPIRCCNHLGRWRRYSLL